MGSGRNNFFCADLNSSESLTADDLRLITKSENCRTYPKDDQDD